MVAVNYTNLDFQNIKQNLIEFLRSQSTWTDYDFEGSNISILLDLLAYNSQYASFLANMLSNESYLDSASIRDNVVLLARQLGYTPLSVTGAYGFFDLRFDLPSPDYPSGFPPSVEIRPGPVYTVNSGPITYTLSTPDTIVTSVSSNTGVATFNNIKLTEGILVEEQFIVDNSNPLQIFKLGNQNIDISTLRVEVQEQPPSTDSTTYNLTNTLNDIDSQSRVFWIDEVDDRLYKLTFGDNVFGYKPGTGAIITARYLISSGPQANGIQGSVNFSFVGNVYDSNNNRVLIDPTITNEPKTEGGSDIESTASIKLRAPRSYAAQNRAVTTDDYESIVRMIYPSAEDVYVYGGEEATPPQYGRVFIVVKPQSGITISSRLKSRIESELRKYKVVSTDVQFVDPGILNIELNSNIYYDETKTRLGTEGIRSKVVSALTNYSVSSTIRKFGGSFRYSRTVALIDDADNSITRNDTNVVLRRDLPVLYNVSATYLVTYGNPFKTDTNRPVISSTGFTVGGSDFTYYLEDDTKGRIYSYYFDSRNKKTISNIVSGTVEYQNGIIKLGYDRSVTITSTEVTGLLQIKVIPAVYDIFAKNEIYLNFDVDNSVLNVIPE